jgi:hypothetical protein
MVPMLYAAGGYPGISACDEAGVACSAWLHLRALLLHNVLLCAEQCRGWYVDALPGGCSIHWCSCVCRIIWSAPAGRTAMVLEILNELAGSPARSTAPGARTSHSLQGGAEPHHRVHHPGLDPLLHVLCCARCRVRVVSLVLHLVHLARLRIALYNLLGWTANVAALVVAARAYAALDHLLAVPGAAKSIPQHRARKGPAFKY